MQQTSQIQLDSKYDVNQFLENLYHQGATKSNEGKNQVYSSSLPNSVKVIIDPFGGCHLQVPQNPMLSSNIQEEVAKLTQYIVDTKQFDSLWLDLDMPCEANTFGICPQGWAIGSDGCNIINDTQKKVLRLWRWLNPTKPCTIPAGATHNLGATAAVVDETAQKILLVQNARRKDSWNLPGGSYEPGKDSIESTLPTALRECQEEAGIDAKNNPAFLAGEVIFPTNQFAPAINQMWKVIFNGGSSITPVPQEGEVLRAVWVSFDDVKKGIYDGIKIGAEIQKAVEATKGFTKQPESKNWMHLYF